MLIIATFQAGFSNLALCSQTHLVPLVAPTTEPSLAEGCANDDECPDHTACENRLCINPCAYRDPCAPTANCQVIKHKPVCSCPDGYIGSPTTSCTLRKSFDKHLSKRGRGTVAQSVEHPSNVPVWFNFTDVGSNPSAVV